MTYRYSALGAAALRMWRGWSVIVPVVVVNAALQALLLWPSVTVDDGALVIVLAVASYVVLLAGYGLVAAVALGVAGGRVGWPLAWGRLRGRALPFALWTTGLAVVVAVGWAFYAVPGLLVLALTAFLPIAVLDGRRSPLRVDLVVVRRRFWRWFVTCLVVGTGGFLGAVVAGFTMFFLRGPLGAGVVWLVTGLLASWVTVAWGLIYRGVDLDVAEPVPAFAADEA